MADRSRDWFAQAERDLEQAEASEADQFWRLMGYRRIVDPCAPENTAPTTL
jgi:hypothetical protein